MTRAVRQNIALKCRTYESPSFSYVIRSIERIEQNLFGTKILPWLPTNLRLPSALGAIGIVILLVAEYAQRLP